MNTAPECQAPDRNISQFFAITAKRTVFSRLHELSMPFPCFQGYSSRQKDKNIR